MEQIISFFRGLFSADGLSPDGWVARASEDAASAPGRYWWGFFVAAGVIATLVYLVQTPEQRRSARGLLAYLLPVRLWKRATARVDVKVFFANMILRVGAFSFIMGAAAALIVTLNLTMPQTSDGALPLWQVLVATLAIAVAADFAEWLAHMLSHKVPLFWAFHRVHHSAETLTPLTASRMHPVEILLEAVCQALVQAPVIVALYMAFGKIDIMLVMGANVLFGVSYLTFTHLRHSHVWVHFPEPIARILSSPAMHQCHHSRHPRHWDRNYGELFSLWDTLFGTLYMPKGRERLVLGLSKEFGVHRPRPHETLADAYFEPFRWYWRQRRNAPSSKTELAIMQDDMVSG